MATLSSDNYQLKWHSFGAHLHSSVATLLQSECYTDVVLCTCDGGQIRAHRFVLSLCSAYFQSIFKYHIKMLSTLPVFVVLPAEIDYLTLKTLVQYMYCGETTVSNDILENVLKAGDCLKIRGLWRPKEPPETNTSPQQTVSKVIPPLETPTTNKKPMPVMKKIVITGDKMRLSNDVVPTISKSIIQSTGNVPVKIALNPENVSTDSNKCKIIEKNNDLLKLGNTSVKIQPGNSSIIQSTNKNDVAIPGCSGIKTTIDNNDQLGKQIDQNNGTEKSDKLVKIVLKRNNTDNDDHAKHEENKVSSDDSEKYLVIKEEPIEWEQLDNVDLSENELFHTEMTIKPEIIFHNDDDEEYQMQIEEDKDEDMYSPLTCELCSETFSLPADWVKHIEGHADLHQPAKRQRRGKPMSDDNTKLPPLVCDLCQKAFPTPGEWVRHIQQTHTEHELALSNNSTPPKNKQIKSSANLKICAICNKRFPSHASMVIHARTHTGERPFVCTLCNKGFNVKSNLLRHLRTLHDKILNATELTDKNDEQSS